MRYKSRTARNNDNAFEAERWMMGSPEVFLDWIEERGIEMDDRDEDDEDGDLSICYPNGIDETIEDGTWVIDLGDGEFELMDDREFWLRFKEV